MFQYIISRGSIVGGIISGWCSNGKNDVKGGVPVEEKENNVNNINREVFQYIISHGSIVGHIIYYIISYHISYILSYIISYIISRGSNSTTIAA